MDGIRDLLDTMVTQPALAAALAGLLSTLITSVATQRSWSSQAKRWFALGVVLVLTVALTLLTFQPISWSQVAAMYGVAAGACQVAYTILKALGISDWLETHTEPQSERAAE